MLATFCVVVARDPTWQARCGYSCRFSSASLLPSIVIDRPSKRTNATDVTPEQRPSLFVAMTTIPPRMSSHLPFAVASIWRQTRPPDHVIVSASRRYARFRGAVPELKAVLPAHAHLDRLTCEVDFGSATKLLCALPRLRELAAAATAAAASRAADGSSSASPSAWGGAWAVLMDDDLKYKSWALGALEHAITKAARRGGRVGALSFDTYTIDADGLAHPGLSAATRPAMLVGAGARVLALRLDSGLLDGIERYYECLKDLEPRSIYHDDVLFAAFLHDVRGIAVHKISGTPTQSAEQTFPNAWEATDSNKAPGALIAMGSEQRGMRPEAGRRLEEARAATGAASPAHEFYSRNAIAKAVADARWRTLREQRCGVRANATWCVGEWCRRSAARPMKGLLPLQHTDTEARGGVPILPV